MDTIFVGIVQNLHSFTLYHTCLNGILDKH